VFRRTAHSKILSATGKASWANLTPKERSVEMKRRAWVRERNRAAKAKVSKTRQGIISTPNARRDKERRAKT
jgi:hypothetical protein